MKLLDDIIQNITEAKEPISDTLRRCLVLAYKLKNDSLKSWVEQELNGYESGGELPAYRQGPSIARGLFLGGYGRMIKDQPLPASVLKEEDRHWASEVKLLQPIASYEGHDGESNAILPWPADLVGFYQRAFFTDDLTLNRAWLEVPGSMIRGLTDTVRTRVLTLVLQIQEELGDSEADLAEAIAPATVERIVNVTILGGHNVIGDVERFNPQAIIAGDLSSLKGALAGLGVNAAELEELDRHLTHDTQADSAKEEAAKEADGWVKKTARRLGEAGLKVGSAVAEETLKQALKHYLGL